MRRWLALPLLLAGACTQYVAATDAGPSAGADAGSSGDAPPAVACDPAQGPQEPAVFVAPDGDDIHGDGTRAAPFATAQRALGVTGVGTVVVAEGQYPAGIEATGANAGITVQGGFVRSGATWTRDCTAGARDRTVIGSNELVGLSVAYTQVALPFTLRDLVLATKDAAAAPSGPGNSVYGALVSGTGTDVRLSNVTVRVGRGGAGAAGAAGAPGSLATCPTVVPCSAGAAGDEAAPAAATPAGTFDEAGYHPGNGSAGRPGADGTNGTDALPTNGACVLCALDGDNNCNQSPITATGYGTCGCHGTAGGGGGAGFGGGASVGVLAVGAGVNVQLEHVDLQVGGGGQGGAPGAGGPGGAGAAGTGPSITCYQACDGACNPASDAPFTATPGGKGGDGSDGTAGGGGAGGDAIGVFFGSGATAGTPEQIELGQGGGGAPAGRSLPRLN